MTATPDRTTVKAATDELSSKLRENLVADPPTATKPFRRLVIGAGGSDEQPRPVLAMRLTRARAIGVTDNDKLIEVSMTLRIVADVTSADPHAAMLDKIGAVEDYLDGIIDIGLLDGVEGLDDRVWTFDYPKTSAGARMIAAEATQAFIVKVERLQNRVPAT